MRDTARGGSAHESGEPARTLLVLGGGGALGAFQAGGLLALLEADVVPDAMFGSSAGALNAAFLATEPTVSRAEQLRDWWTDPRTQHVLLPAGWVRLRGIARSVTAGARSILDPAPLRRIIEEHVPAHDLSELRIPLTVTTTCLDCAAPRHHNRGPIVDALAASCALPGLFPPVQLPTNSPRSDCPTSHLHVDGGVLCGVPLTAALADAGPADRVIVLDCGLAPVTSRPGRCAAAPSQETIGAWPLSGDDEATLEGTASAACGLFPVLPHRPYVAPIERSRGLVDVVLRAFTVARAVANRTEIAAAMRDPRVHVMPHVADAWAAGLLDELPGGPRDFRRARLLTEAGYDATRQLLTTEALDVVQVDNLFSRGPGLDD